MSRDIERFDRIVVALWRPRTIADWIDHLVFAQACEAASVQKASLNAEPLRATALEVP